MLSRRRIVAGLGLAGLLKPMQGPVAAQSRTDGVSEWVASDHARVRLIDAGGDGSRRLAGLQIQLDPSYLTYWRTPGEAGVAPVASFEGSRNLVSVKLAFPAPQRFDEGGAEAFGYKDDIVFPLSIVPADVRQPVMLAVSLSFAVCSDLCLPAVAATRLELTGKGDDPEAGLVRDAQRRVPVLRPLGDAGPLAVEALTADAAGARVLVRSPSLPVLFAEAPEAWYVQPGSGRTDGDGRFVFDLRVLSGPKEPARIPIALTLVTDEAAVETTAHLDAAAPTP